MNSRVLISLLAACCVVSAAAPPRALAQVAELRADVISGGAGANASAEHILKSTVGAWPGDTADGPEHRLATGFWGRVRPPAGALVPAAPALTTPADGSVDVPLAVTFAWTAASGAASYDLQLALDDGFAAMVIDTTGLTATEFEVGGLAGSTTYFWRVRSANSTGAGAFVGPFSFTTATEVAVDDPEIPGRFMLEQNYPNPFNPSTTISYALPVTAFVRLVVYNVYGREVAVLVNGSMPAGRHEVAFASPGIASGVYVYRIDTAGFTAVRRMILVK